MKKFIFATDFHYGFERRSGHKKPLHDEKAIAAMLKFAADFRPDVFILGGDVIDAGCISHHNSGKPGLTEGLRLIDDVAGAHKKIIQPIEELKPSQMVYITGNHCAWLDQLTDVMPALQGIVNLKALLKLDKWTVVPQGGVFNLGKLTFMHGDTVSGGEHIAKAAVINYERSVRFGHYHTFQTYTKNSPLDSKQAKTGIAVPCLCRKGPGYGKGKPNKWVNGFLWGYVAPDGSFNDYVSIIHEGRFTGPTGKVYKG